MRSIVEIVSRPVPIREGPVSRTTNPCNPIKKKCKNNVGAHAPVYLLNSCVSTHKQRRDCGHVAARIAQTESKTASIHAPEGLFL